MMGKLANVWRWASTFALDGSSAWVRDSAALTYCSVWNMSTFQSKKRSISAEPRLVMDLTFSSPGTLFTASSRGRVMVTIIRSIGITPLSTAIKIRGKLVAGKTATGTVKARYPPTNARVTVRKITDREWCANQYGDFLSLEVTYGFSSLLESLEDDPSPAEGLSLPFSVSVSFSFSFAASTETLVLSGRP